MDISKLPKWAQAEVRRLQTEIATSKAMRWPSYTEPQPIDAEAAGATYDAPVPGWHSHGYATCNWRVTLGYTTGGSHVQDGKYDPARRYTSGSQNPDRFYLTRLDALRQARLQITDECARTLAQIDREIAAEELNPTT